MDRKMIYPGQIPLETDLLDTNRFALIGLGKLAAAVLGTTTLVNGLACTPTAPASMQVQVAPGEIYSLQNLDGTAYSSLAADTTHQVLKQGLMMDAATLSCPAPGTAGQSINYLVQVTYQDVDANPTVLPYYNASNPAQAYSGPNNSGTSQSTVRQGVCQVAVKVGVAATSGTQVTPAPDPGYTGLYVVTVANGASTITGANISTYSGAPFLTENLTQKISQTTGDARYATQVGFQQNAYSVANAGGTADAITATYSPAVTALTNGMTFGVRASSANATTTPTFTPNSGTIAAKTIVKGNGLPLVASDIAGGGHWIEMQYDSTLDRWVLLNPATGVSASTLPLAALPFPTIATASKTISATGNVVAGQGGSVSVPAGVLLSIGQEVVAGSTGVLAGFTTQAWTSGNLAVSSTYYLRAQVQSGALVFYVQKGADSDSTPASQKGTPDGAAGGGFDSTVIDMLVAKVVTGAAGTTPTVTLLANAYRLRSRTMATDNCTRTTGGSGVITGKRATPLTLNWARTPTVYQTRTAYGIVGSAANPEELNVIYSGSSSDGSGTQTATFSRYVFDPVFAGDWNTASTSFQFFFQTDYLVEA